MTERKRDHVSTILTVIILSAIAGTYLYPTLTILLLAVLAVVSVPIVIWNCINSSL